MKAVQRTAAGKAPLPGAVWALGLTSLFMDISSELIHGLLPVFLVVTLGASATALGLVEGIAEATAQITRVFSGWLSDVLGKRKALTVAGYGLAAVTKPLFPLANSIGLVLVARFARSHRQGHQRRAARCAGRRPDVRRAEGRGLRLAPIARHGRRHARPAAGDRADVSLQRRHPHRAVVRGDSSGARGHGPRVRRRGAGASRAKGRRRRFVSPTSGNSGRPIGS